jgi:hypothetical protein
MFSSNHDAYSNTMYYEHHSFKYKNEYTDMKKTRWSVTKLGGGANG